jgi:amino acid transporter
MEMVCSDRTDVKPIDNPIDVQLRLYAQLREEVLQAINTQHRTFIAESFFVSIVFSFSLIGTIFLKPQDTLLNINILSAILSFLVAPIIIFLTSLWLIEQSRMMRAGEFLEWLEDEINVQLNGPYLIWENWLRRDGVSPFDVHRLHHYAQHIIILMFLLLGFISIGIILTIENSYPVYIWLFNVCVMIYTVFLCCLSYIYFRAITHRHGRKEKGDSNISLLILIMCITVGIFLVFFISKAEFPIYIRYLCAVLFIFFIIYIIILLFKQLSTEIKSPSEEMNTHCKDPYYKFREKYSERLEKLHLYFEKDYSS